MDHTHSLHATVAFISVLSLYGCAMDAGGADIADEPIEISSSAVISASPFGCSGTHVALRTMTGHYVVAEGGGGGDVNANRAQIGPWETFTVHDLGGSKIALQTYNGHFVVAEYGGGDVVKADRPWLGPWETFTLDHHWNGSAWTFQSYNGYYVVAEGGGGGDVNANRPWVGPWEAFWAICLG